MGTIRYAAPIIVATRVEDFKLVGYQASQRRRGKGERMESNHQTKWIRMGAPFMAIVLLAIAPHPVEAQAQAPQKATSDLQQLKDELQQAEDRQINYRCNCPDERFGSHRAKCADSSSACHRGDIFC
jgi:hypothetical protein